MIFGLAKLKKFYKNGELPNIPHIDKIRKFKIMIYLCDVNLDNGPHFYPNVM